MIKKYVISAFIASANLFSAEPHPKDLVFKYIAVGSEASLGFRAHEKHGYDISVSHNFILEKNYSIKGYYLNYPLYKKNVFAYWGIGLGAVYWEKAPLRNGKYHEHPPAGITRIIQRTYIKNEIVIGYELHVGKNTKIFSQFELGNGILFLSPELFPAFKIGTSF